MKCLFCDAEESCFVEVFAWDFTRQRARELMLQGVCTMHASDTEPHPLDPSVMTLHPKLTDRREKLARLHWSQFGNACDIPLDKSFLRYGMQYWPLDSEQGRTVRAARGHHVDTGVARVGGPVEDIVVERVPTMAAMLEILRDQASKN